MLAPLLAKSHLNSTLPRRAGAHAKKDPGRKREPGLFLYELLVRLAGIEPTTPWFVAKYSIQLSYSRDERDYSSVAPNRQGRCCRRARAMAAQLPCTAAGTMAHD